MRERGDERVRERETHTSVDGSALGIGTGLQISSSFSNKSITQGSCDSSNGSSLTTVCSCEK